MAGINNPEYPIPMLDTVEAIVEADESIEPFILSLFPEADQHQISYVKQYLAGVLLDGIEFGRILEQNGATDDVPKELVPLPQIESELDTDGQRHLPTLFLDFCKQNEASNHRPFEWPEF
jgi:hypothetical protein